MGQDSRDHAAGPADGEHVLGEHQVRLLAGGGTPAPAEALGELHAGAAVILAEGRIGDHPVETHQLATFLVSRVEQGVLKLDVGVPHPVQQHVEFADGPGGGVVDLSGQVEVFGVAAGLLDELPADDQHAAGAAGRIVNPHARAGFEHAHHQPNHVARGIEVTPLLARRLGEHVDQKFVGAAEQVGELKILVTQPVTVEMAHQILARLVTDHPPGPLGARKLDVPQDMGQGVVVLLQTQQGLVEPPTEGLGGVIQLGVQIVPTGVGWDKEGVEIVRVLAVAPFRLVLNQTLGDLSADNPLALGLELVRTAFEKQQSEDVILVGGGVQSLLSQPVGSAIKVTFQLGKRQFGHGLFEGGRGST